MGFVYFVVGVFNQMSKRRLGHKYVAEPGFSAIELAVPRLLVEFEKNRFV